MSYYTARYRNNKTKDPFFKNFYADNLEKAEKQAREFQKNCLAPFVTLEIVYIKGKQNASNRSRNTSR
jgi:hypothetical protein